MSISRWLSDMLEILSWSEGSEIAYEDFIFQRTLEKEGRSGGDRLKSEGEEDDELGETIPQELPILPLRGMVVFPLTGVTLTIGQPRSIRLVDDVVGGDRLIGLVASKNPELENPSPEHLYKVGTVATVHRMFRAPDDTIRLLVQGTQRFKTEEFTQDEPYLKARIKLIPEDDTENLEVEALARNVRGHFERIAEMITSIPQEIIASVLRLDDPLQVVYAIANFQRMELEEAQEILEIDPVVEKLHKLNGMLSREVEVLELGQKIQNEARTEIEKVQRDYFLREQLKAIQKELGEKDEHAAEVDEFREKIKKAKMSEEAQEQATREAERLASISPASAEYGVIRTYLEWLVSLPWAKVTQDNLDIQHARNVLDEDHYGLKDVKERILEYLAVRKLRHEREDEWDRTRKLDSIRREREGVILCFVGPPGVGKTSLGRSIARALGREFIRISLGGVRDEAEMRGHRRTYIGALPGRIIQALRRVESKNPVFMMDEVDKLGHDFRGDPASALLEVLDPEQNSEFRDHYLEVAFDLSQVMFITTANLLEPIPGPLRDRMEIIHISSYTENDKIEIAKKYLIPRQLREKGLRRKEVSFHKAAIQKIVQSYTREAGVRNLEREIGRICRKVVTRIASGEEEKVKVTTELVRELLGRPKYYSMQEIASRTSMPGVATGLSWTPFGGDVLFIEATHMPGSKGFQLTGSLGEVMQESARAALSYVRSRANELGLEEDFFSNVDVHLHVPAGAQPKDGPSAGVTMVTAIASMALRKPILPSVAMTGEVTLRGQILPVGGVKEKVLAAHRAGLKTIILPKDNEADLEEIPEEVVKDLDFKFVKTVDQALAIAIKGFGNKKSRQSATREKKAEKKGNAIA